MEELGAYELPNLLAMNAEGGGVYLPAHVQPVSLPLSAGKGLRCASLPGLRRELVALAERWDLPQEDEGFAIFCEWLRTRSTARWPICRRC